MTLTVIEGRKIVDRSLDAAEILPVERAVIGCVLLEGSVRIPPLLPQEFYLDAHRTIWETILTTDAEGLGVNVLIVRARMAQAGERHDGVLALCYEDGSIAAHLPGYARLVREAARERMLRALGMELQAQGLTEDEIRRRLDDLPGPLTSAIFDPADDWQTIVGRWSGKRILTGLRDLDAMAGGLPPGTFVVIGGRTSMGKTSLLTHLANVLAEARHPVEYLTLEESRESIVRRLIANRAGLSIARLVDGTLFGDEFARSQTAVRWLQDIPLRVTGVEHLRAIDEDTVVGMVAASTAAVVIVDHLQQITTKDQSRVYGLERVVKRLHASALRDGKVLLCGAQLGRDMDNPPRPPRLSDLRDSASIEIAARQVWLLYWGCKHDRNVDPGKYEVFVAKHSDGPTGVVSLHFDAITGRFADVTP